MNIGVIRLPVFFLAFFLIFLEAQASVLPVADAGIDQSVTEGQVMVLNGLDSIVADPSTAIYQWTQVTGTPVIINNANTATPNFIAPQVGSLGEQLTFQLVVSDGVNVSAPDFVSIFVRNINQNPVANAGSNQIVLTNSLITLNGSSSSDPDGDSLIYIWEQTSGPAVVLDLTNPAQPKFIAPGIATTLSFSLTVSDGSSLSAPSTVVITVKYPNLAPIAFAGNDQTVNMQTTVTLDGTGSSDPNGDAITYSWTQVTGPAVVLNLSNPSRPTFLAPKVPVDGAIVTFSLVVSDGVLVSDPSIVNINIKNVNQAPIANAGTPQIVSNGTTVTLDGSNSYDPDGDIINYSWAQISGPAVIITNANTVSPEFVAPNVSTSTDLTFRLTVSDGKASGIATVIITVQKVNQSPVAVVGQPQTVLSGTIATLDGSSSYDPDGDNLSYTWTQTFGPTAVIDLTDPVHPRVLTPNVNQLTTLTFSLTVFDGLAHSQAATVNIYVKPAQSPPACHLARPSKKTLWPPNHRMKEIKVKNVFERSPDDDGDNDDDEDDDLKDSGNTLVYTGISQDEPTSGLGNGDAPIDGVIKQKFVLLRQERKGNGTGRVYTVRFTATNAQGASCNGSVKVCVPLNANNKTCTEEATSYDSTK